MDEFATALERSDIGLSSPVGQLQGRLGLPQSRLHRYREALAAAPDAASLINSIRTAAALSYASAAIEPKLQLAWTYPGRSRPGARTTGGVAREIIDASERTLLLVGFAVTVDPALTGLASQTVNAIAVAAARGVMVTAVLHRGANKHALLATWRPGVPMPSIFTWPSPDSKASVHAKLLVADGDDALVTSANLTYHGFEKNLEMGVRVTGRVAGEIHDRIHELIASGDLVAWLD